MAGNVKNYKVIDLREYAEKRARKRLKQQEQQQALLARRAEREQQRLAREQERKRQAHGNKGRVYSPETLERIRQLHKERAQRRRDAKAAQATNNNQL